MNLMWCEQALFDETVVIFTLVCFYWSMVQNGPHHLQQGLSLALASQLCQEADLERNPPASAS